MNVLRALVLMAAALWRAGFATGQGGLDEVNALMDAGRSQEALERLNVFLGAHPDDAGALFLKGILLLQEEERTDQAIEIFTGLTEDYPHLPEPYNNLAALYAARGDYQKATETLLVAVRVHPSYAMAYENLGDLYAKMAADAYDRALALDEQNRAAQAKLALVNELFSEQGSKLAPNRRLPAESRVETGASDLPKESQPAITPSVLYSAGQEPVPPPESQFDVESVTEPSSSVTSARQSGTALYVQAEVLNMRDGPGTGTDVLRQVRRGQALTEVGRQGQWIHVRVSNTDLLGWVHSAYVSLGTD